MNLFYGPKSYTRNALARTREKDRATKLSSQRARDEIPAWEHRGRARGNSVLDTREAFVLIASIDKRPGPFVRSLVSLQRLYYGLQMDSDRVCVRACVCVPAKSSEIKNRAQFHVVVVDVGDKVLRCRA